MTKRIFLIVLLGCGLYQAHAQQYFNRRYTLHAYQTALSAIIPQDGKYFCTGVAFDSSNSTSTSITGVKFTILDSLGNILKDTIYQRAGARNYFPQYNNALCSMPDKGFLLAVAQDYNPTTDTCYAMLIRYDSLGSVLWTKEMDKPFCVDTFTFYTVADLKPTGTGEWLMLTTIQCTIYPQYPTHCVLTKLDSNFNVIWNKEYDNLLPRNSGDKLFIDQSGYYFLSDYNNVCYPIMTGLVCQAQIIKTDSAGNEQWVWRSDTHKENSSSFDLIHTKDGGFVYCGIGNGYEIDEGGAGYLYQKGWIEKLDSNRNVVWYDTIDNIYNNGTPLTVLKELDDSTIVVAGDLTGGFNQDTVKYDIGYACLIKYKPNGDKIWQRKYSYNNDSLIGSIYDMKQTPDGGFVLCGESDDYFLYYGNTLQQAWVIKVDSNGCLGPTDPQCLTEGVPGVARGVAVSVYPNPVGSTLTFATDYLPAREELTITDLLGQTILTERITTLKQQIDVRAWPPGVYIYYLSSAGSPVVTGKVVKY